MDDEDTVEDTTNKVKTTLKRSSSHTPKKTTPTKKSKVTPTKSKTTKTAKTKVKTRTKSVNSENDLPADEDDLDSKQAADADDLNRDNAHENHESSAAKTLSIEEKRKALQAEKLRKQKEMEALEAEEEALLLAEAEAASNGETLVEDEQQQASQSNEGAEAHSDVEYDDRALNGSESEVEEHEPLEEAGLAGLDDDEEDFDDDLREAEKHQDELENKKRTISPVTWDVDVHANDDNISDDSPIHSQDESDGEHGEINEDSKEKMATEKSEKTQSKTVEKKPIVDGESMRPRIHKYLYREAKYFMVKSSNHENVRLAKAKGVWSTPPQNEIRFNRAVEENTTVILVFSVKESGAFQGFARINGPSQKDGPKIAWVLPPGISAKALSGVFKLDWISRTDLSFDKTTQLRNPWNSHKPVKIARDGQEIEPHVGEQLCKMFTLDGSSDYERVISRIKRKRESLQARGAKPSNRAHSGQSRDAPFDTRGHSRGYRGHYRGGLRSMSSYNRGPQPYQSRSSGPPQNYSTNSNQYYLNNRNSYEYRPSSGHHPYQGSNQFPPNNYDIFVKGSYEEYLNEMRSRAGNYFQDVGSVPLNEPYPLYHSSNRDGPPPPPIPSYSSSRDRDRDRSRPSSDRYERDVEDFLRRTGGSSRYRRSDGRSSDRYKESRDRHERGRSRSRERERYRERR